MLTILAKASEKPTVVVEIIAAVLVIGVLMGGLVGIVGVIDFIWHRVFGSEERTPGASAHTPTAFNCHLPRARQSNEVYECPQGHIWISYQHQRRVRGRLVYDPYSPGPPPQKPLIREPDHWVNDGLKWRYKEQREPAATEASPH
jgi:hypothetical protein